MRIGLPSASQSLPALQEAIGVARLYAPSGALLQALLGLLSASDRVERTLTTREATAERARVDWDTFEPCLGALANECAATLALAEGRERPPFEQVTIGREPQGRAVSEHD